jgi:hypothetical protein
LQRPGRHHERERRALQGDSTFLAFHANDSRRMRSTAAMPAERSSNPSVK